MLMSEQEVETALEQQIMSRYTARAAEINVVNQVVPIVRGLKLAHPDPLGVEGEHPSLGQINATDLFIIGRLAIEVMTVNVEDHGDLAVEFVGLVEQGRHPESGQSLIA